MYYHAAVLLLFRPFLKAKFTQSDISPQDVCRASAAAISQIFDQHRRLYDSIGIYTLQIHCLLAACTVHIINTPAIASTQYLTSAAHHFHHLAGLNAWASECINILKDLVSNWNIFLPMEAEAALYRDETVAGSGESEPNRNKRAAYGQPNVPPNPQQKKPKLSAPRMLNQQSSSLSNNSDRRPSLLPETSTGSNSSLSYLFAPFPNQPPPMLGPIHTSNIMLGEKTLQGQMLNHRLGDFDGLTFEMGNNGEGGWFDSFMGFDPQNAGQA